jgi:hypothetical protein
MWQSKFAALVAAATLSLDASAGMVQYDFSGTFSDGATINGFFVQSTDDKSVAYYNFGLQGGATLARHFAPSGVMDNLTGAFTHFTGAGPTTFAVYDDQDVERHNVVLEFYSSLTAGQYRMRASYVQQWWGNAPVVPDGGASDELLNGVATVGVLDDNLRMALEGGQTDGLRHIVPQYAPEPGAAPVPEPGTLALLLLGAAGAFGARRRVSGAV